MNRVTVKDRKCGRVYLYLSAVYREILNRPSRVCVCLCMCCDVIRGSSMLSKRDSTRMSFGLIVTYPSGQVE